MSVQEHHVHVSPVSTYLKVFGALIVLTLLTVAVSYAGLPPTLSILVAMVVAATKASIVGAWFMHLKYDTKFNLLAFLSAVWFASMFFTFTTFDLGSRGAILEVQDNFTFKMDEAQAAMPVEPVPAAEEAPAVEEAATEAPEGGDAVADAGGGEDEAATEEAAASDFDAAGAYVVCAACHGDAGDGKGPAGAALQPPPRDFTNAAWWDGTTDEHVAKVIKEGGAANGLSPLMAAYGGMYDDAQIAAIVEHLKTFKK